jgi:hypothetical protein
MMKGSMGKKDCEEGGKRHGKSKLKHLLK